MITNKLTEKELDLEIFGLETYGKDAFPHHDDWLRGLKELKEFRREARIRLGFTTHSDQ